MNRVTYRKYMGDDRYSWALFIDGVPVYTGMDKQEAQWRAKQARENIAEGRLWNAVRA